VGGAESVVYDGVTGDLLAHRLRAPGLRCLAEVTSTLDVVHALATDGAPAGTAVLADRQTHGRGRHGRPWFSPARAGIWLGYLVRPTAPLETGVLALRVGLTVAGVVEALGGDPRLKWPNDVLLGDRKLAGVLCEARWPAGAPGWIAVGVGMNVHGPLPGEIVDRAVALNSTIPASRIDVLERLVPSLLGLPLATRLDDAERAAFARWDWLCGRRLVAPIAGIAAGIDGDGALLVETPSGVRRVVAGSVEVA
jgi:BirA family biotin operon repressor/biotin-[acetyl-CoA-carboxylase] ligase